MMAMRKSGDGTRVDFGVGILHAERLGIVLALRMAVGVALGAFKAFQLVFPERFTIAGIDMEIEKLIEDANTLFKSYAPKDERRGRTV
jgi:hypothetical protein